MTSGIYQLTFSNGSFYIGKSNDIERRWKEHFTKFGKGTAAAAMQAAYDSYGEPSCKIILECHEDHIDVWEAHFITWNYNRPGCLNTSCPKPVDIPSNASLNPDYLTMSMWEHIQLMTKQEKEIDKLKDKVRQVKNGSLVEELESKLYNEKVNVEFYKKQVEKLKSRGFFARLFNL